MAMLLPEGIAVDMEKTFGELKFSALKREKFVRDENNEATAEVEERVYDLKSKEQGMMIEVKLPPEVGKKDFSYNAVVKLVNPVLRAYALPPSNGYASAEWELRADDIILDESAAGTSQGETKTGADKPGAETGKAGMEVGKTGAGNLDKAAGEASSDAGKDGKDRK